MCRPSADPAGRNKPRGLSPAALSRATNMGRNSRTSLRNSLGAHWFRSYHPASSAAVSANPRAALRCRRARMTDIGELPNFAKRICDSFHTGVGDLGCEEASVVVGGDVFK